MEEDEDEAKQRRGPKSVGNLPLSSLHALGSALCDEHYPLHFKIYEDGPSTGKLLPFYIKCRDGRLTGCTQI